MRLCCRSLTRTRLAFALTGLTLALGTGVARAETSAGYDKGFFIKSDNWEIHLGTRTQLQLSTTDPDTFMFDSTLGKRTNTDRLNELNIRRFKFFGTDTIFNPAVKFKFQLDVERFKPGGGSTGRGGLPGQSRGLNPRRHRFASFWSSSKSASVRRRCWVFVPDISTLRNL